jgi:hypothetical protein
MRRNYSPADMLRTYKVILLTALLPIISISCYSQSKTTTQALYWLRYHNQLQFSPSVYWANEFDNRRFFGHDVANQFIIHSRVHFKKERWDYAAGITASWVFAQIPENGYDHSTLELRPVIEASYEIPFRTWALINRLRIDNRFFEVNEQESIFEHADFTLRLRYRLLGKFPIKRNEEGEASMHIRIADEIMINHRENLFDQNRIYANYDVAISKSFTLDVGYIYIYQQRFGRDDFFERHVFRFSVLHKVRFY